MKTATTYTAADYRRNNAADIRRRNIGRLKEAAAALAIIAVAVVIFYALALYSMT